ncbi:MAG: MOSC domain-containing protein [Bacteroidota bacterium]
MSLDQLMANFHQKGRITWIGIRETRKAPLTEVKEVTADQATGLIGDHYAGKTNKTRQVTLIQAEHLKAVASFMGRDQVDPGLVRRNIVVQGINLLSLKDKQFSIGDAILECTGLCHPCSRMEQNLGVGGYNAMRGHGGITARVIKGGLIKLEDIIRVVDQKIQ